MSKALKVFGGLTVQMLWGMGNIVALIAAGGSPGAVVGAHAHFGVLSILAAVTGFAVDEFEVAGRQRSVAVYGFVLGQWPLPLTTALETASRQIALLAFVWGILLMASMGIMAYNASRQ